MKRLLVIFAVSVFTITAHADLINIPDDYSTIQQGIAVAVDDDTVLVSSGSYSENILINNKNITLASHFLTTGDSSFIDNTIINGNASGTCIYMYYANSNIIGLTITNGLAERGGGIYCDNSLARIEANVISQSGAIATDSAAGGGIYLSYSDAIIYGNVIENNFSDGALFPNGGGVYAAYSSPAIQKNTFKNNTAGGGGGLYFKDSNPSLVQNLIIMNHGLFGGGGVYAHNSVVDILNCTFSGNESDWYKGGAIYFDGNFLNIVNSILYYNIALLENPEIHLESGTAVVEHTDIDGGWEGIGNLDMHPYFRDLNNDFHLMAIECGDSEDSPLIDMGSGDILDEILDCDYGLGTLISDMGAYGGADSVGISVDDQAVSLPSRITLNQNYPNPFNASTTISFSIPESQNVKLTIYDMLGRKVSTLVDGVKAAGEHQLTWQASDHSSGIYFVRLNTENYTGSKRLILLK